MDVRDEILAWGVPEPVDASFPVRDDDRRLPASVRHRELETVLMLVPAGKYIRGVDLADDVGDRDERPAHEVVIPTAFYVGREVITQDAYRRITGKNPSMNLQQGAHPVERISWNEATEFCSRLSLRLPTEGEWEYACRFGTSGSRYGPLNDIAWYYRNAGGQTRPVGGKRANPLGLVDMIGNVLEWCLDWYAPEEYARCYPLVVNPAGPADGTLKVVRGGAYDSHPSGLCRATARYGLAPSMQHDTVGFRVVKEIGALLEA